MKKILLLCCVAVLWLWSVFAVYEPTLKDWKAINTLEPMLEELLENDEEQFAFVEQFLEGAAAKFSEETKKWWIARELLERMSDIEDAAMNKFMDMNYISEVDYIFLKRYIHVLWDANARISIITFSDYECPFCKKFNNDQAVKEVVDSTNELYWFELVNRAFTHFPLSFHEYAYFAAVTAECIEGEYWIEWFYAYTDAIFKQERLNETVIEAVIEAVVDTVWFDQLWVDSQWYDVSGIMECAKSQKYSGNIVTIQEIARDLWVTWTPNSFIIDNETLEIRKISWAVPKQVLEEELWLMIQ